MLRIENLENSVDVGALAVLDAMGDAISVQDTDLRIVYQNQSHLKLMGDHMGEFCYEAYQKRTSACPGCHLLESFNKGKSFTRETSTQHSTRGTVYVEILSAPLRDNTGRIVAGIESVRDITERKLLEEKLRLVNGDLEQKTWKLMASNNELESFSYTISHDMRNFITRISTASQALREEHVVDKDSAATFLLGTIDDACQEMEDLIEAILLLTRAGKGGGEYREVDLGVLASEIGLELRVQYPQCNVELEIAPGLEAYGDRLLLKVMLVNLLGNAWKYAGTIPGAKISLFAEDHEGKRVFVLRDNGPGFDMKEVGRLFRPFSRLSSSRGVKGMGIGLATVRRIVQSHGGEIWGKGAPGKGATFYFTLPTA